MSKGNGINRKKLVPFILSIIIFPQNPMQRIFEKQTERRSCRRDSGRNYVLSAGSTEDWKSFVPGLQREVACLEEAEEQGKQEQRQIQENDIVQRCA